MPSQQDFDLHKLHVNDRSLDHCGGKNPLWFVAIVFLTFTCASCLFVYGIWKLWVRLHPVGN